MHSIAQDFTSRLADLLRSERVSMADFLLALADFDRRRLWLDLGHPSLFVYLHRELGLSNGAAHFRKVAAGLVQRFPQVIEPLRDGRLCITSAVALARVATAENIGEVLPRFFHCSKREAKEVAAEIRPVEVIPRREVVTAVRAAARLDEAAPEREVCGGELATSLRPDEPVPAREPVGGQHATALRLDELPMPERGVPAAEAETGAAPVAESRRASGELSVEPLTANLRRLHVTVTRRFMEKLEKARAALSHPLPGADAEEILEAGLDLIIAAKERRMGVVDKPLRNPRPSKTGHIASSVSRQVWKRDQGRCQWPVSGKAGGTCGSTYKVERDHIGPRAWGGGASAEEIRLLCRVHQILAARLAFGDRWMDRYTREAARVDPREPVSDQPASAADNGPSG